MVSNWSSIDRFLASYRTKTLVGLTDTTNVRCNRFAGTYWGNSKCKTVQTDY